MKRNWKRNRNQANFVKWNCNQGCGAAADLFWSEPAKFMPLRLRLRTRCRYFDDFFSRKSHIVVRRWNTSIRRQFYWGEHWHNTQNKENWEYLSFSAKMRQQFSICALSHCYRTTMVCDALMSHPYSKLYRLHDFVNLAKRYRKIEDLFLLEYFSFRSIFCSQNRICMALQRYAADRNLLTSAFGSTVIATASVCISKKCFFELE